MISYSTPELLPTISSYVDESLALFKKVLRSFFLLTSLTNPSVRGFFRHNTFQSLITRTEDVELPSTAFSLKFGTYLTTVALIHHHTTRAVDGVLAHLLGTIRRARQRLDVRKYDDQK